MLSAVYAEPVRHPVLQLCAAAAYDDPDPTMRISRARRWRKNIRVDVPDFLVGIDVRTQAQVPALIERILASQHAPVMAVETALWDLFMLFDLVRVMHVDEELATRA